MPKFINWDKFSNLQKYNPPPLQHPVGLNSFISTLIPLLYLKLLKKKNFNINIPYLINKKIRINFSLKIIVKRAFKSSKKKFYLNLKDEFYNTASKKTENINFKTDTHKLVYVYKNFSHYRWF